MSLRVDERIAEYEGTTQVGFASVFCFAEWIFLFDRLSSSVRPQCVLGFGFGPSSYVIHYSRASNLEVVLDKISSLSRVFVQSRQQLQVRSSTTSPSGMYFGSRIFLSSSSPRFRTSPARIRSLNETPELLFFIS